MLVFICFGNLSITLGTYSIANLNKVCMEKCLNVFNDPDNELIYINIGNKWIIHMNLKNLTDIKTPCEKEVHLIVLNVHFQII